MNVNVGFIGLGIMGKPMALNLIKGGYPLWVYGRRVESMAPLVAAGANSAGQVAKACNQIVMLMTLQGLAEAFTFARNNGLDLERVYESLSGGSSQCRILEVLGKRMVERNYDPGIEARLHYKDIQIVLDEAHTLGMALPGTALITQMFNALIGRGGGNEDSSQLVEVIEAISKTRQ